MKTKKNKEDIKRIELLTECYKKMFNFELKPVNEQKHKKSMEEKVKDMENAFEKLINYLNTASQEQLDADWEKLKKYNELGPVLTEFTDEEQKENEQIDDSKIDINSNTSIFELFEHARSYINNDKWMMIDDGLYTIYYHVYRLGNGIVLENNKWSLFDCYYDKKITITFESVNYIKEISSIAFRSGFLDKFKVSFVDEKYIEQILKNKIIK